ncbi:glycosyltransferase family 4 protein [Thermodesulfovibrio sp. Kuro-1]|uniref:glycosyltransferase family 4 protein n=1 Tax=Thermodesulfovibrio sp. Kuro-1 TaxID=2580394 RepID=UPI001142CC93|nr:glycosyltransferase [Thermodesulfovibrio sp. Kuro-1]
MISYLFLSFFISFIISLFIIIQSKRISSLISDHLHVGPQRFHYSPTPRIGGTGIFIALPGALALVFLRRESCSYDFVLLILCSVPVFFAGFLEDILAKFSVKLRLLLIGIGPTMAFFLLDASIKRVDIPLDAFLSFGIFSFIFTVFAIVGITNAINIIDGFNGLASMVSMIILLALGYVSYKGGDHFLIIFCISLIGAIAGFFILNYPNGLIFLGDGGAYLIGFLIGTISVLLGNRHSEVSPWFPFVVCVYPIFEVVFSMYRKTFIRGISPFSPDGLHLHMIIYKRLTKKLLGPTALPFSGFYAHLE